MFQHQLAMGGQTDATAMTIHQTAAELRLQNLDTATQRRLAKMHNLSNTDEVTVFSEDHEVTKLT